MSVSKAIRNILKRAGKSPAELAPFLNNSPQYVSVKITRGPIDNEFIKALSDVTNIDIKEIISIIDAARREEKKEVSFEGKIHELEDKIKSLKIINLKNDALLKNYENTFKLLNEITSISEEFKNSQLLTIEVLNKALNDKDKELERANKLIEKLEEKIRKSKL